MLYRDGANVLATLVILGLILATFLVFPTWSHDLTVLGSPLTVRITQTVMMAVLLVGIACSGTDLVVRSHPTARRVGARFTFATWTLPALRPFAIFFHSRGLSLYPTSLSRSLRACWAFTLLRFTLPGFLNAFFIACGVISLNVTR